MNPPSSAVLIGALAPLTRPGWADAGRHLLAGLELGARHVNAAGGIAGAPVELLVRDTAADPGRAADAVAELAGLGVVALAGEYHSVAARTVAAEAEARDLPFVCSSAVLDALTDEPAERVARIAPPQSHGWRIYADFLLGAGHRRIAVAADPSVYWASGIRILRECFAPHGATIAELDMRTLTPEAVCDAVAADDATALLLLVGHPQPAVPIVRAVRADRRLDDVLLGAPAGQPELADWHELLGDAGAGIPFLRYLSDHPSPLATRVEAELREHLGQAPSFVAFEGYDTISVLAEALRARTFDWSRIAVEGTRGPIRFARTPDSGVWQWTWPPVHVAERVPGDPDRFRVR